MNNFLKKILGNTNSTKTNLILYWISIVVLGFAIFRLLNQRIQIYFISKIPKGDEGIFVDSFHFFIQNGWYESISKGSSPLFNLFAYPFYLLTQNTLFSFKILNVFCLIVFFIIWIWFFLEELTLNNKIKIASILFLIQLGLTQNTFFMGVNDALFALLVSAGFIAIYGGIRYENSKRVIVSAFLFGAALSVRELLMIYLPGIALLFVVSILLNLINLRIVLLWILTFIITTGIIHLPSLIENKNLSSLDKNPKSINATWVERNYLQVLQQTKKQPSWDEVLAYKRMHGENELPTKIHTAILMNPSLTFKNFIKQFYLSQMPLVRQLGLFYFFIILFIVTSFRKYAQMKTNFVWIPALFYCCYTLLLCIQIIPTLQFRWFVVFPFLLTVFSILKISKRITKNSWIETLFYLNILVIGMANILLIGIW